MPWLRSRQASILVQTLNMFEFVLKLVSKKNKAAAAGTRRRAYEAKIRTVSGALVLFDAVALLGACDLPVPRLVPEPIFLLFFVAWLAPPHAWRP